MTHGTPTGDDARDPSRTGVPTRGPSDDPPPPRRRAILAIGATLVIATAAVVGTRVWSTGSAAPAPTSPTPGVQSTPSAASPAPGSALAAWPLWSTIPGSTVDLTAVPHRHVDRALAVVRTADPTDGGALALFALDQTDGAWVRLDLPDGVPAPGHGIALSADGRSIASTGSDSDVQLYDLATGARRTVTIPPTTATGCRSAWSSFSSDGAHLAVLSTCGTELSANAPERSTSVVEIDLTTRDVRQVALAPGTYAPPEPSLAYAPDGTTIAIGTLDVGSDTDGTLTVVAHDGSTVARWVGTATLDAVDPWRDDRTVLVSGIDPTGSGTPMWLDTTTSRITPAVLAPADSDVSLAPMLFAAGMLVARADPTTADTPGTTVWVCDTAHGTRAPWLTFTGASVLSVLLPATPAPSGMSSSGMSSSGTPTSGTPTSGPAPSAR